MRLLDRPSVIDCTRLNMPVSITESPARTSIATGGPYYIVMPYIKMYLNSYIWTKITTGRNMLTRLNFDVRSA